MKNLKLIQKRWIPISWTCGSGMIGELTIYMKPLRKPVLKNTTELPLMRLGG